MQNIDAQSCRALKSRGSRTSRRIVMRTSTNGLPNQEAVPRILFCAQRNTPIFICDSPGGGPEGEALAIAGLYGSHIHRAIVLIIVVSVGLVIFHKLKLD